MTQVIKQNGAVIMSSPENRSCNMIFRNLTGLNGIDHQREYLQMMFYDFPSLTYGEIELWEDGNMIDKGEIKKY